MLRYILTLIFIISFSAFAHAQPTSVGVNYLKDYFIINDAGLKKQTNFLVLTNRKDMDKIFGTTTRADTPDFSKEWMLIMSLPESKKESKLSFDRISTKAGNFIEVYYTIKRNLYPITYKQTPVIVAVIPRNKAVKYINFYELASLQLTESIVMKEEKSN